MKEIEEKEGDQESHASEKPKMESDSDEELDRTNEIIELEHVSVKSSKTKASEKPQKAILSPEDVQKIKAQQAKEEAEAEKAELAKKLKE